jgi:hypothetical protein
MLEYVGIQMVHYMYIDHQILPKKITKLMTQKHKEAECMKQSICFVQSDHPLSTCLKYIKIFLSFCKDLKFHLTKRVYGISSHQLGKHIRR